MHGHELVEHLFPLKSPKNEYVGAKLDGIRNMFQDITDELVNQTDVTDEQRIAIYKTHEAMQSWITAVVLYQ